MSEEHDNPEWGEKGEGDGPNLRYDDFVGRIVQDPKEPPGVTLLSGYLGSSSEEGHVRLYLDEELSRYVELPRKAIRHTQELPPEQSPLGGSLVWLDRDAEVLHGAAGSERRKATFLEGQIAQDYIGGYGVAGGGSTTTQTRDCGGGILPTDMGPGCGQSQFAYCIPPTKLLGCHTRTGIFCSRLGPGCGLTSFDPVCTLAGQHCHTALVQQCQSVYYPCFTQNKFDCQVSGFVPCNPPIDFTRYEQPGMQQQFAGGGGAGAFAGGQDFAAAQGLVFAPPVTAPIICNRTGFGPDCYTIIQDVCNVRTTAVKCQSIDIPCPPPTRSGLRCFYVSRIVVCSDTRTGPGCVIGTIDCPTRDLRCRVSQVAICDTRICEVQSVACGVDPAGGGQQQQQGFAAQGFAALPTQTTDCQGGGIPQTRICPSAVDACPTRYHCPSQYTPCQSVLVRCPSQVDACPTRFRCPSQFEPCQSQLIRCQSQLDACPTRYNCPTLPNGCPVPTQFGRCETYGACPSAVDACPTRFGCYETQVCGGESIACYPGGGGGGFDPGGFGGGGGYGGGF